MIHIKKNQLKYKKVEKYLYILIIMILFLQHGYLYSKNNDMKFYGNNETKIELNHAYNYENNGGIEIPWGFNNLTNLRIKKDILDWITFSMAVNIGMFSGIFTDNCLFDMDNNILILPPFYPSNSFIGSFALERMQLAFDWDIIDVNVGVLRISRGFGYMFSPTDLFNPKNPINPGARPEGRLSLLCNIWPDDSIRIQVFAVAPDNPLEKTGWGSKFGIASNLYLGKTNFEFLYSLLLPEIEYNTDPESLELPSYINNKFTHIAGFSLKADFEIGFFIDAIYRFEQRVFDSNEYYGKEFKVYNLLEGAAGIDYTFDNKIYILLEYMYYGSGMLDTDEEIDKIYENSSDTDWEEIPPIERKDILNLNLKPLPFLRHNYLFLMTQYPVINILDLGFNLLFGVDDVSCLFTLSVDLHDPLRKINMNISGSYPVDTHLFDSENPPGEFGPIHLGFHQKYTLTFKFKY